MEKSFLSFQSSCPSSEPNLEGKKFLSSLKTFREQRDHDPMQEWAPNTRDQGSWDNYCSRDRTWPVAPDHARYPYFLESYYVSQHDHHHYDGPLDIEAGLINVEDKGVMNMWAPPDVGSDRGQFDEKWCTLFMDRTGSNLEASTSRTILQHNDFRNFCQAARSQWWDPRGVSSVSRTGIGTQTSFLEPPNFHQNNYYDVHDNLSDNSFQEQDQQFDWRTAEKHFNYLLMIFTIHNHKVHQEPTSKID